MRLIDADKIPWLNCPMHVDGFQTIKKMAIDAMPTVVAEPVIRCKDCKYWDDHWAGLNITKCKAFDWRSKPDDFCSFADRKEA